MSGIAAQAIDQGSDMARVAFDDLDEMAVRMGQATRDIGAAIIPDRCPEDFVEFFKVVGMKGRSASINDADKSIRHAVITFGAVSSWPISALARGKSTQ